MGEKHAAQTAALGGAVYGQTTDESVRYGMAWQPSRQPLGRGEQLDRRSTQRVEAEHRIGASGGADERPAYAAPNILAASLSRKFIRSLFAMFVTLVFASFFQVSVNA
ncbi:MAG: hypothetical protein J4F40_17240 [Alphaproteobacteria bacterium]|nr:hypothetical protein [Alphaproteobacteria bacterium]